MVWSDEKKFSLDGPDGFAVKWRDNREPRQTFPKRQNSGEGIIVWAVFAGTRKNDLVLLVGLQNGA